MNYFRSLNNRSTGEVPAGRAGSVPTRHIKPRSLSPGEQYSDAPPLGSFACRFLLVPGHADWARQLGDGLSARGHTVFIGNTEPRQLLNEVGALQPAVVVIQTAAGVSGVLAGCVLSSCIRASSFIAQPLIFVCSSVEDGICSREAKLAGVDSVLRIPTTCEEIVSLARSAILRPRARVQSHPSQSTA